MSVPQGASSMASSLKEGSKEGKVIYTLGYAQKGAMQCLTRLVEHLPVMIVDIRLSPYSRFLPDFRQSSLRERFKDRYVYIPELGNLNYRDHALPIRIADPDAGVSMIFELLRDGWGICLLCVCSQYSRCHRLVVANLLVSAYPWLSVQHLQSREGVYV